MNGLTDANVPLKGQETTNCANGARGKLNGLELLIPNGITGKSDGFVDLPAIWSGKSLKGSSSSSSYSSSCVSACLASSTSGNRVSKASTRSMTRAMERSTRSRVASVDCYFFVNSMVIDFNMAQSYLELKHSSSSLPDGGGGGPYFGGMVSKK
jgi:hypothetical protein